MSATQKPSVQFRVEKFLDGMAYVEWTTTDELGKSKTHSTTVIVSELHDTLNKIMTTLNPDHVGTYPGRLAKQIERGSRRAAVTLFLEPQEKKAS
jgi:hypothetical protein